MTLLWTMSIEARHAPPAVASAHHNLCAHLKQFASNSSGFNHWCAHIPTDNEDVFHLYVWLHCMVFVDATLAPAFQDSWLHPYPLFNDPHACRAAFFRK